MPKAARDQTAGVLYHVGTRGNDRNNVVFDEFDRTTFLRVLATVVVEYRWKCVAFTMLDNHYYLVIEPTEENLALGMAQLNGKYARRFNWRHGRSDHVFGKPYWSEAIESDEHLASVATYIPANAPKAGLCDRAEEWPWCSYAATIGLAPMPTFLDPDPLVGLFGNDVARARERYLAQVDEYVLACRGGTHTG